jgi:predicted enzyme related to lactoylglutathione lyase
MPVMAAQIQLPAIVEPASQEHHVGKLIFVELVTPDIAAAKKFYAGLFGWTFRDIQDGGTKYAEAFLDGRPVAGLIHKNVPASEHRQPAWLSFFAVSDVDAAKKLLCKMARRFCSSRIAFLIAAGKQSSRIRREPFLRSSLPVTVIRPMFWPHPENGFGAR